MFEEEFSRKDFISEADGLRDWYLVRRGDPAKPAVVMLHGHGSCGDQLIRRPDVIEWHTKLLVEQNHSIISPNYRGNSWMSAAAQQDLVQILQAEKPLLNWRKLLMISGSMGGTSNLIFALHHADLVNGIGVMGAATDPGTYLDWLAIQDNRAVLAEIRAAIAAAFPSAAARGENSVLLHADLLKDLPIVYYHGGADEIIPVAQARALAAKLGTGKHFIYHEIPGGDHDSPLRCFREILQLLLQMI